VQIKDKGEEVSCLSYHQFLDSATGPDGIAHDLFTCFINENGCFT